jgi:hypothetical protein
MSSFGVLFFVFLIISFTQTIAYSLHPSGNIRKQNEKGDNHAKIEPNQPTNWGGLALSPLCRIMLFRKLDILLTYALISGQTEGLGQQKTPFQYIGHELVSPFIVQMGPE